MANPLDLVDIDLSIFNSPAERYDLDVRKQNAWVPGLSYQAARAQGLQSCLELPRAAATVPRRSIVTLLDGHARINLAASLAFEGRRLAQ